MTGLLSPAHIVVLLIVLLLVFGAKRLPELGRSLGSGMREFKQSIGGETGDETLTSAPAPATPLTMSSTPATAGAPTTPIEPDLVPDPVAIANSATADATHTSPPSA